MRVPREILLLDLSSNCKDARTGSAALSGPFWRRRSRSAGAGQASGAVERDRERSGEDASAGCPRPRAPACGGGKQQACGLRSKIPHNLPLQMFERRPERCGPAWALTGKQYWRCGVIRERGYGVRALAHPQNPRRTLAATDSRTVDMKAVTR